MRPSTARSRAVLLHLAVREWRGHQSRRAAGRSARELLRHGAVADAGKAGLEPDYVDATAHVTVSPQDGGFRITESHLVCEATVAGIDHAAFLQLANAAKAGCPVSQALAGVEITLDAHLAAA